MNVIDFTNCKRVFGRAYNGANGKKIAVEYNDKVYMLKFPPSAQRKPINLSYTNSCISEHICSSIYNFLGMEAQHTLLGLYNVNGKSKVVCACEDFTDYDNVLYDFCSIKNTVIDSENNGNGTEINDIIETISLQNFVNSKELLEHFWNMFVIDTLLGNFDRHNGNWGFLVNRKTNECKIAPIFDCGSCLLPQADEKIMKAVLENEDELNARIYTFPTSAIKYGGNKLNYYDFLNNTTDVNLIKAIKDIYPRINISEINSFIDDVPFITDLQREFYKTYIFARYEKLLKPVYNRIKK